MSDVFEKAFGATKGAIQMSAETPLGAFPAQSTIAQAGTINAGNAAMAAIEDNAAVQKKYADNADIIAIESNKALNATAQSVAQVAQKSMDALVLGRDGLRAESLAAIEKQKQLSEVRSSKPNPLLSPIDWVADTLQENKLEGQIQDHAEAIKVYNRNINNVVTSTSIQVEEMLSMQNMTTSAAMRERAAILNEGLGAAQVDAQKQTQLAATGGKIVADVYTIAKGHADWAQAEYRNSLSAEQNAIGKRANQLQAEKMQREADAARHRDGAIKQAARFYLLSKNLPNTEANMNMAMTTMSDMQAKGDPTFVSWSRFGAAAVNSSDSKSAVAAAVQSGTVGDIRQLGLLTGNKELASIGNEQLVNKTTTYEAQLKKQAHKTLTEQGATKLGYEAWSLGLKPDQNKAYRAQAESMAQNEVYNQSGAAYVTSKGSSRRIDQSGMSLVAFKSPTTLVNTYKLSPEAAKVLSNPQVQLSLSNVASGEYEDKKTAQITSMINLLHKAGVRNPVGEVAKITKVTGESLLDADSEAKALGQYGIVSSGAGVLMYKGQPYKMDSAEDIYRMYQIRTGVMKPSLPAFVGGKVGDFLKAGVQGTTEAVLDVPVVGTLLEGTGKGIGILTAKGVIAATESRDAEFYGTKPKETGLTPTEAATAASKFTPAGQSPQASGQKVSGGIPATAASEAEKLGALPPPDYSDVEMPLPPELVVNAETALGLDSLPTATRIETSTKPTSVTQARRDLAANFSGSRPATAPPVSRPLPTVTPSASYERAIEVAPPVVQQAVVVPVTSPKATTKAVNIVEEAIKDGTLPKKEAVPIIKQKVQEAKKADEPKAADQWSNLLDTVAGKVNTAIAGSAWSNDPKQQKQYESGLSRDSSTMQPSKDYNVGMMGLLGNDSTVYAAGWQPEGTPIKGIAVKIAHKPSGEDYAVPVSFAEVEAYTGGKLSTTNWSKFTAEDHRRINRTALDILKKKLTK